MSTIDYFEWGPEELCKSPLWLSNLPPVSGIFSFSTAPEHLREQQPRVLRIGAGSGDMGLQGSLPSAAEKTYTLNIEAKTGSSASVEFGIRFGEGIAKIDAVLSSEYQVFSGKVTLPSTVTDPEFYISKTGSGVAYVSMVSVREINSNTSPDGWSSAYRLAPGVADGFVSADGQVILIRDAEGNVVGSIGPREDGTSGVTLWEGATPPTPTGLSAVGQVGGVLLTWDGKFIGGRERPGDLEWMEVYASTSDFNAVEQAEFLGTLSAEGGTFLVPGIPPSTIYVALRSKTQAKKISPLSATVNATPMSVLDETEYAQRMADAEQALDEASIWIAESGAILQQKVGQLESDVANNELALDDLRTNTIPGLNAELMTLRDVTLPAVEQSLEELRDNTLPELDGRLEAAEQLLEIVEEGLDDLSGVLGRLDQAEQDISAAESRLNAAEQDIIDVFGEVGEAKQDASAAASAAQAAQSTADTARSEATSKAAAAEAAAKAHADAEANAARLAAIAAASGDATDKANAAQAAAEAAAAADATAKANAAQAAAEAKAQTAQDTADAAHAAAGAAQNTADAAMTAAGRTTAVFYSTAAPSSPGVKEGDTWRQRDSSHNIIAEWRWTGSAWQKQEIKSEMISNLDVGKLTAGTANIQTLVAQKIAAASGQFIELDVSQLTASAATMGTAVINKLWADVVKSREITADMIGANQIVADHITASSAMWTKVLGAHKIDASEINASSIAGAVGSFLSLNANQITSGTINTARLNAQSVAGAIGTFLSIGTDQLTVSGSAGFDQAVVDELWAKKIAAGKITADEVVIGGQRNRVPNGYGTLLDSESGWAYGSNVLSWSSSGGPPGTPGYWSMSHRYAHGSSSNFVEEASFELDPGVVGLGVWVRRTSDTASGSFVMKLLGAEGYMSNPDHQVGFSNSYTGGAEMWAAESKLPKDEWVWCYGTFRLSEARRVMVNIRAGATASRVDVAGVYVANLTDSSLIVDGGILARHLNVTQEMWANIINFAKIKGEHIDADSIRSAILTANVIKANMLDVQSIDSSNDKALTIQPDGIRLYSSADIDGEPAVSLTTSGADYLSITSNGATVAGMDNEGHVVGNVISAAERLEVEGQDILDIINAGPRGVVARYTQDIRGRTTTSASGGLYGRLAFMEIVYDHEANRVYELSTENINVNLTSDTWAIFRAWWTTDGTKPTFSHYHGVRTLSIVQHRDGSNQNHSMSGGMLFTGATNRTVRILLGLQIEGPNGKVTIHQNENGGDLRAHIIDHGTHAFEESGGNRTEKESHNAPPSGGGDPAPKKTYTNTWTANNSASYTGSGSLYSYAGRDVYQGYWLAANGNLRGLWTFPSTAWSTTSGSEVTKVELYVKNSHARWNNGLTAYFGTHSRSTVANPGTTRSNGWTTRFAKGEGKWITLSGDALSYFKTRLQGGNPVGMMIYTTGSDNYGYFAGEAKIRVTYKK